MSFDDDSPPVQSESCMPQQLQQPRRQREFSDSIAEVKQILRDFLTRLRYRDPHTPRNEKLRTEISAEIISWDVHLSSKQIAGITDTACTMAESGYAHMDYEYQRLVAKYTAPVVYIVNLETRDLEVVAQFGHQLLAGEDFSNTSLERLIVLLRGMYALYPRSACDSFIASTLNFFVGVHSELTGGERGVLPGATPYPRHMREKTGLGPSFALFNFVKDWREPMDTIHLQLVPDLEFFTIMVNDVFSFYKELIAGETNTFIHLRAAAEQKDPIVVLREVAEETLESINRMQALTASDPQLWEICNSYLMGSAEFHLRATRYRLKELDMDFEQTA